VQSGPLLQCSVHLEMVTAQLGAILSDLMEHEGLLPILQQPATTPYPEPANTNLLYIHVLVLPGIYSTVI